MIFFLLPLKAMSAVRMMAKEIRFRMNVIASTNDDLVFSLSFFSQNFVKMSCLFTCSTVSAKNEWSEASVFNFTNTFILLGLFNCFVLFQGCFLGFMHLPGTVWMCYSDVEERFLKGPPETSAGYVESRLFLCISCMRKNIS